MYKDYEKKLINIVNKIIDNKKNNDNYYKEFKDELNNFFSIIYENAIRCHQEISKCHKDEIKKYSISKIYKNEDIIPISFKESLIKESFFTYYGIQFGIAFVGSFTGPILATILGAFSLIDFCVGFACMLWFGVTTLPIDLLVYYILFKINNNKKRKEKIKKQFEVYFKKISTIKERILNKMEEIYKIAFNDLRKYKISQINPMKNIYDNKAKFESIIEQFKNICIEIEKNN